MNSRITVSEAAPEDLRARPEAQVEVLNSRLHRKLDDEDDCISDLGGIDDTGSVRAVGSMRYA